MFCSFYSMAWIMSPRHSVTHSRLGALKDLFSHMSTGVPTVVKWRLWPPLNIRERNSCGLAHWHTHVCSQTPFVFFVVSSFERLRLRTEGVTFDNHMSRHMTNRSSRWYTINTYLWLMFNHSHVPQLIIDPVGWHFLVVSHHWHWEIP